MHLGLGRALEIRELALLEDRLGRIRRGRAPGRARLFEAEIGQRRANVLPTNKMCGKWNEGGSLFYWAVLTITTVRLSG